jgi:hypothetical protein
MLAIGSQSLETQCANLLVPLLWLLRLQQEELEQLE